MAFGSPQWMYSSGEYEIDQSLKFAQNRGTTLTRTASQAPTNNKIGTWSFWIKKTEIIDDNEQSVFHSRNANNAAGFVNCDFHYDNYEHSIMFSVNYSGGNAALLITKAQYRDPSAWMHVVIAYDSTQSTASDRVNIYVNGEKITEFYTETYPDQNRVLERWGESGIPNNIGSNPRTANRAYLDGYLAEFHYVDGQQLTQADFGETGTYGEWKPKEYSGTYGTNGFYLPFKQDYTVEGFSTITWKGNSTNNRYFGGTGFKPDLIWAKARSIGYSHSLYDSVRGYGSVHNLVTNTAEAENGGNHVYGGIASSSADGFTTFVGSDGGNPYANHNEDGRTYVAWNWDMGADTPTGFGCITYTGNGGIQNVSGFGFSPDLIWFKRRSTAGSHALVDKVRGSTKWFESSGTQADQTFANNNLNFDTDGVRLDYNGGYNNINQNGTTYVAWGWDMGNTTASNTSGTINSTVMANTTYGQSIVSFTGNGTNGATVGHGLSSAPELVWVTNRDDARNSSIWHTSIPNTHYLHLDQTSASASNTAYWNSTSPTSSVFTLGTSNDINGSSDNMIAYCFHSVSGYSKIGSYSGTGSTGNSVTTGFRPAFLLIKRDADEGWQIIDSTRNPLNTATASLSPNSTGAERTDLVDVDFTSTGFTLQNTDSSINASGATYLYYAVAGGMDSISDYNTDGSIDSRVKANTTYGQSIVSYEATGSAATVGHGLSSAPEMMIVKHRDQAGTSWVVYNHQMATSNSHHKYLRLNSTVALIDDINAWNDTAPTSSVFSVGPNGGDTNNSSGGSTIAYLWHSVSGYSSIGRYTGNGSATGPSVTTGFRPAWIMIKGSTVAENWNVIDATRSPTNVGNKARLQANASTAEGATWACDFNDNGFQIKSTDGEVNTNGEYYIYMAFADKREYAYWLDQSGNNNDWTSDNLTESDISVDSPTNNFCTMNPLTHSSNATYQEGNLRIETPNYPWSRGTFAVSSGKWYWEWTHHDGTYPTYSGICNDNRVPGGENHSAANNQAWYGNTSGILKDWNSSSWVDRTDLAVDDIIGIAVDLDNGSIKWYKNNTLVHTDSSLPAGEEITAMLSGTNDGTSGSGWGDITFNFGQDSSFSSFKTAQGNQDSNDIGDFYYTPPTGFLALCTKNLPDVDVKPQEHFNTITYTGTGLANNPQTVGFQPDFVWFKSRSAARAHVLVDAVRGVTKELVTNTTNAEQTSSATQDLTAFTSTGFTLGTPYNNSPNESGASIVAWNWKANGSGSSNTNGSITSTVSANVDAGFSIVSFAGDGGVDTIGHGLSKAPEVMVLKNRNASDSNWIFWHKDFATNHNISLNLTNPSSANGQYFFGDGTNMTVPTSTVFTVGNNSQVNNSGDNTIAYCFHSVDGYSKVGAYTGNGSTDGTFVYTSFAPAYILWKNVTDAGTNWVVFDNKRDTYNPNDDALYPNASTAEEEDYDVDFLSNGFKFRNTSSWANLNGKSYIYLAFAESPFKYSNAR